VSQARGLESPSARPSGRCSDFPFFLAYPELAWPLSCVAVLTTAVLITAITPDQALVLRLKSFDDPDSGLAVEFAKMACRKRIAEIEVVLAEPGNIPVHTLTLRCPEATDALLKPLRRAPI